MARRSKGASDETIIQNAAKTLYANIRFSSVDNPVKSIVVTSSVPNEGKTTITHNLAVAIASSGKKVLLVECDMRRRSMANELGVHARSGVYAVLSGRVELDQAVVTTHQQGLMFLDSEPHIPNPADILSSQRFKNFLAAAERVYDYVIVDTPPLTAFVDAALVASLVDATVLVVREGFTRRNDLVTAHEQLVKADANVIGAVMNMCETGSDEYYSYYTKKDKSRKSNWDGDDEVAESAPATGTRTFGGAVAQQATPIVPAAGGDSRRGSRFSR